MLVDLDRENINLILTWASFYDLPQDEDLELIDKLEQLLQEFDEDED